MFKKILIIALTLGILGQMTPAFASNESLHHKPINIFINKKALYSDLDSTGGPLIKNNRVFVPLRPISENFNAEVTWNSKTKTITIENKVNNLEYIFKIGQKTYLKNGVPIKIDQPPFITPANEALIPIRVIGEMYGKVDWDSKNRNVIITTKEKTNTTVLDEQTHPKKVQEGLERGLYKGIAKDIMSNYITNRTDERYNLFDNYKVYYLDNSDFLDLSIIKSQNNFVVQSNLNGANVVGWYIDNTGTLQDGINGKTLQYAFKSPEEANTKLKYLVLDDLQNKEIRYIIRVSQPILLLNN